MVRSAPSAPPCSSTIDLRRSAGPVSLIEMPRRGGLQRTRHHGAGARSPPIASTATVTGDIGEAGGGSVFFDCPDLPAVVEAAVRADHVRGLGLPALRTCANGDWLEGIVRPALGRARLGVSSFGIRHGFTFVTSNCELLELTVQQFLQEPPGADRPILAALALLDGCDSSRTPGRGPGSPAGTGASSAARERTARASPRRDRSCRPCRTIRRRRRPALPARHRSAFPPDSGRNIKSNGAFDRNLERLETAAAIHLECRPQPADEPDLLGVLLQARRRTRPDAISESPRLPARKAAASYVRATRSTSPRKPRRSSNMAPSGRAICADRKQQS